MVSIIITTYNREFYLEKCLKSILSQSYTDFCVIVVSDGYFKETEKLIDSLNDNRVKLISNSHTGLPAVSRNVGLKKVKNKYVCFCDDDDVWHEDKLAMQVKFIEVNNFDVVFTAVSFIDSEDSDISYNESFGKKKYNHYLINMKYGIFFKNFICLSSTLMRSNIISTINFNESVEFRGSEDYIFWLELVINNRKLHFLNHKLVKYRIHANNLSRNKNEAYVRTLKAIKFLSSKYPDYRFPLAISELFYSIKRIFL